MQRLPEPKRQSSHCLTPGLVLLGCAAEIGGMIRKKVPIHG
jgi:hypothetical protein